MPKNVLRGEILGIAGQAWHMLAALLLYAYLARELGPVAFGRWRVVISLLSWFEVFVASGLVRATAKAVSQRPDDCAEVVSSSYKAQLAVSLGVFGVLLVAAGPIASILDGEGLAGLIRIASIDIPLYAVFMLASAVVLGMQRFERQAAGWVTYATAKALLIGGLVAAGFGVAGALVVNALSSIVGFAALYTRPTRRQADAPADGGPRPAVARARRSSALVWAMLAASLPFLLLSLLDGLAQNVDLWFVSGSAVSARNVGLYAAAVAIAETPVFLFLGMNRVLMPAVAASVAAGDRPLTARYARQSVRLAMLTTAFGLAVTASAGREVLALIYSRPYAAAFGPLAILILAASGRTVWATCTEVLVARDQRRAALVLIGTALAGEVLLLAALIPRMGGLGAAAAVAASTLLAAAAGWVLLRDLLGARPLATLMRSLGAGLAVSVPLAALRPAGLPLIAAIAVAAAAYLALLALAGEFDPEDRASLRAALGKEVPSA